MRKWRHSRGNSIGRTYLSVVFFLHDSLGILSPTPPPHPHTLTTRLHCCTLFHAILLKYCWCANRKLPPAIMYCSLGLPLVCSLHPPPSLPTPTKHHLQYKRLRYLLRCLASLHRNIYSFRPRYARHFHSINREQCRNQQAGATRAFFVWPS